MESTKVKWGILGTGWIARKLGDALKVVADAEIYAVGSRNMATAQRFADEFNIPKAYGSYEDLVNDPEVDVIYVATPHNLHLSNTLLALDHGKHVLCEKPMGVNRKEVTAMLEKAKEKNLFLMEAMWSRFLPNILKTKELVESGAIGEVKLLTASFCIKSSPEQQYRHLCLEPCGGTTLDIGIYNIFLSLFLLGEPSAITASAGINEQGCDTSSNYTFRYANDTLAVMYSSFLAESPVVAEIHGTKGKISLEHLWFCPGKVTLKLNESDEQIFDFDVKANGYEFEVEEVVACLKAGKIQSDLWSWADSLQLVDMMDKIRQQCGIVYPNHDI